MSKVKNFKTYAEITAETAKKYLGENWEQYSSNHDPEGVYVELTFSVDADLRCSKEGRTRFNSRDMEVSYDPPEDSACELSNTRILNQKTNTLEEFNHDTFEEIIGEDGLENLRVELFEKDSDF